MIAFEEKISDQIKTAMKAKDPIRLNTLRAMKSALKYKEVEKKGADVSDEEALQVFNSLIKQRKDSVEQFESAGKVDEATKEKTEIAVIQEFLPAPFSEDEVKKLVLEAIKKTGVTSKKEMGLVMKEIRPLTLGRADGKLVSDLVRANLTD